MNRRNYTGIAVALVTLTALAVGLRQPIFGQPPDAAKGGKGGFGKGAPGGPGGGGKGAPGGPGGGPGGFGKGPAPAPLPKEPTAVTLPTLSEKVTGPGMMYDTGKAHWTGHGLDAYKYVLDEYFVTGTANGKPYKTRLAIRRPSDDKKFSGLVMTELTHFSGNAHGWGYNAIYIMTSGHIAAEFVAATAGVGEFTNFNKERYGSISMTGDQQSEIIAQLGALIRSDKGPLKGLKVRKEIFWGTSQSAGVVQSYLPAHMVYRTPEMKDIYDGFLATSFGGELQKVDVPTIEVPTQNEYRNPAQTTKRPDGDVPGDQFRLYEFAGMGHLDARFDPRMTGACAEPLSKYPMEAHMSVSLNYLFQWVDQGKAPPKAPRIEVENGMMALDENGNAKGGIRSPYLDLALFKYTAQSPAAAGTTVPQAALLCGLSNWVTPIPQDKLKAMYKDKKNYAKKFEARLKELEKAGWSLPLYHSLMVEDAKKIAAF